MSTDRRRRPPAYQEYGSDLLGKESVRLMSLADRGLLATMRWYVWANDTAPSDPDKLALVLGLPPEEVRKGLPALVPEFFQPTEDNPDRLYCPELADQMDRLRARHDERVASGRRGGRARKGSPRSPSDHVKAQLQAKPEAEPEAVVKLPEKKREEQKRDEQKRGELCKVIDEFVRDYENAEQQERDHARHRLVAGGA